MATPFQTSVVNVLSRTYDKDGYDPAASLFEKMPAQEQARILHAYRNGALELPSEALKAFFEKWAGYERSADPNAAIRQKLDELKSRLPGPRPPLTPGFASMKLYCEANPAPESSWEQAVLFETHALGIHLYLTDLDRRHDLDPANADADSARGEIQTALAGLYDPRAFDSDGDGALDCRDISPLDNAEIPADWNAAKASGKLRYKIDSSVPNAGGRRYLEVNSAWKWTVYAQSDGADKPTRIVLPILLLPVTKTVDLGEMTRREAALEKKISALMPEDWAKHFRVDLVFCTSPDQAIREATPTRQNPYTVPYHVLRVHDLLPADSRAHAGTFSVKVDDAVTVHEFAHHLGFPDRYDEHRTHRDRTLAPGWPVWSHNDAMNDMNGSYLSAADWAKLTHGLTDWRQSGDFVSPEKASVFVRNLVFETVRSALWRGDGAEARRLLADHPVEGAPVGVTNYYLGMSHEDSDPQRALAHYEAAVRDGFQALCDHGCSDLADCHWYVRIGEFFASRGRTAAAKDLYAKILEAMPGNPAALFFSGKTTPALRASAHGELEKAADANPRDFWVRYFLARSHMDAGQWQAAADHFEATFGLVDTDMAETVLHYPGSERYRLYSQTQQRLAESLGVRLKAEEDLAKWGRLASRISNYHSKAIWLYARGLYVNPNDAELEGQMMDFLTRLESGFVDRENIMSDLLTIALNFAERNQGAKAGQVLRQLAPLSTTEGEISMQTELDADFFVREALKHWNVFGAYLAEAPLPFRFADPALEESYLRACAAHPKADIGHLFSLSHFLIEKAARTQDENFLAEAARVFLEMTRRPVQSPADRYEPADFIFHLSQEFNNLDWSLIDALEPVLSELGMATIRFHGLIAQRAAQEGNRERLTNAWNKEIPFPSDDAKYRAEIDGLFFEHVASRDPETTALMERRYLERPYSFSFSGWEDGPNPFWLHLQGQSGRLGRVASDKRARFKAEAQRLLNEGERAVRAGTMEGLAEIHGRARALLDQAQALDSTFDGTTPAAEKRKRLAENWVMHERAAPLRIWSLILGGEASMERYSALAQAYRSLYLSTREPEWRERARTAFQNAYAAMDDATSNLSQASLLRDMASFYSECMNDRETAADYEREAAAVSR